MFQKGKYEQVSSMSDDICGSWGGHGWEQGQGTRSLHSWGGGFREWVGKETMSPTSYTVLSFIKFLLSSVPIHKGSLILCCLYLRIDLISFSPLVTI